MRGEPFSIAMTGTPACAENLASACARFSADHASTLEIFSYLHRSSAFGGTWFFFGRSRPDLPCPAHMGHCPALYHAFLICHEVILFPSERRSLCLLPISSCSFDPARGWWQSRNCSCTIGMSRWGSIEESPRAALMVH